MQALSLLRLLHLVSPALPIGAYAYSQGLEYAIESRKVVDKVTLVNWLRSVMSLGLGRLDVPFLYRFIEAWSKESIDHVNSLNDELRAYRETKEFLLEDEQLGEALRRLLFSYDMQAASSINYRQKPSYVCQFALAGWSWGVPSVQLAQGFLWAWAENQVAVATKVIPLGQTDAQHVLSELMEDIELVSIQSKALSDDELGAGLPGLTFVSARHEQQYSRLFRS